MKRAVALLWPARPPSLPLRASAPAFSSLHPPLNFLHPSIHSFVWCRLGSRRRRAAPARGPWAVRWAAPWPAASGATASASPWAWCVLLLFSFYLARTACRQSLTPHRAHPISSSPGRRRRRGRAGRADRRAAGGARGIPAGHEHGRLWRGREPGHAHALGAEHLIAASHVSGEGVTCSALCVRIE